MSETREIEPDTTLMTFTVTNARAVNSKSLFALVDVEMLIAGVSLACAAERNRKPENRHKTIQKSHAEVRGHGWLETAVSYAKYAIERQGRASVSYG